MKRTPLKRRTPLRSSPGRPQRSAFPKRGAQQPSAGLRARVDRPSARQLRWRESVRRLGSIITCEFPVEIHHCAGRTARHDGVHVGHWWILPLTREQHQGADGIHAHPDRKAREKSLFEEVLSRAERRRIAGEEIELPPADVIAAIRSYRR